MNFYIAKLVFRILSGKGEHQGQFDEQLRLIMADDDLNALKKAKAIGLTEETSFMNEKKQAVQWKFIAVVELTQFDKLDHGAELYYQITEVEQSEQYINKLLSRSANLEYNSKMFSITH